MSYIYLVVAIIIEIGATSSLKASDGFTNWLFTLLSLIGYGVSFYFLSMALREISVGIAYAIWSGIGTVGICLFAWLVYKQNLSFISVVGIVFIVTGVIIVNFGNMGNHT
ncbi:Multidrug transporter EmrE and related cation transporters (EmrE) (PDB:2I68) [Commensalibacter communis]|uniref:Multidrug transporter EmrE and related cation transporters (EmrE) n=1 Tax=Commensalibacter communis TaxID=2972786 RepID=A0A9W4TMY6_9PROT|nr:multidrug efflux SMR transporter [Commensalibacter communis]CAI3949344.1 Multidrug transporter EmrE and related cation transporters (EmrE) (PDB:2I68) [Commensalibacter communis]CAI3950542.1 Multidrug transporter EmrE and related cation transporters (EmrE) (PDB:2I68) [Commensalibacter communis]CAI3952150.1 Multidrug transporter EmrE and related cation transporters (EmrE) (PDB:2I68) [Commensalibacter communis]CAI3952466.1 Multidrug transporter EmrE and related cation transporters (EmrE) (PDB:2